MKRRQPQFLFVVTLVATDILMAALAFYGAYALRRWLPFPSPAPELSSPLRYAPLMVAHTLSILLAFAYSRLYRLTRTPSRVDEFYRIVGASTVGSVLGVALAYLAFKNTPWEQDYPRGMVVYAWVLTILFVTVGRLIHGRLRAVLKARGWGRNRVLVVGTGEIARMILHKIQGNPGMGYKIAGVVTTNGQSDVALPAPILGHAGDLAQLIEQHQVEEVIIALPDASHQDILTLISECERGKATIKIFPDVFQIMAGQMDIGDLGGLPLLTLRDIALRGWRQGFKRTMDIAGAGAVLILVSPLMLLTAILIKLDSPGPVFYVQERMGLDARPFPILKFRSMRQDAEADGPGWTRKGDPRVTTLGTVMRKLNVDELPQLINVVIGEMSLVGPRPERSVYVAQFRRSIPRYMDRHRAKAGMTGWAQINGLRGDTSIVERTKYDLWYIENWSLLLDIKILIRTAFSLFHSPNAY